MSSYEGYDYWEPPEGSTHGSDPYLCSMCADKDEKEVPADIRVADISGYHHAGTDAVMVKTESGWEMTEPIEEYTIADIKDAADSYAGKKKTGYCKDCWIQFMRGAGKTADVMNKKLFGAEDWPPTNTPGNAVVLIDNSGSTAMEDTGMTDKKTGHQLNRLDRHVLTAAVYLANFPKQGNYMIITPSHSAVRGGVYDNFYAHIRSFDNTDDAIEHLFTIRPGGGGFSSRPDFKSEIDELMKRQNYSNVLLLMDEPIGHFL